jgi:dienelactone hydrolase
VIDRFAQLPQSLREQSRWEKLGPGGIPSLLVHPDWSSPSPVVIWMHGRTANKELDSGRYLRWLRAQGPRGTGIATCSLDLPGHGERFDRTLQHPEHTPDMLAQMIGEIDKVIEALADPRWKGVFDLDRLAIGGMSAGGMVTLRRLCDEHPFVCASVEGTTGCINALYSNGGPWNVEQDGEKLRSLDAESRVSQWKPIPLLALHAERDEIVPLALQQRFIDALRAHYKSVGADPSIANLITFGSTGAPQEHSGFGRFANDAKNAQTAFLSRVLLGAEPSPAPNTQS